MKHSEAIGHVPKLNILATTRGSFWTRNRTVVCVSLYDIAHSRCSGFKSMFAAAQLRVKSAFANRKCSDFVDLLVRSQTLHLIQISIPADAYQRPSSGTEAPAKRARVRFADDYTTSSSSTISRPNGASITQTATTSKLVQPLNRSSDAVQGERGALNLCTAKEDMCNRLGSHARSTLHSPDNFDVYLDTADDIRHYLYPVCDPKECLSSRAKTKPTTLENIFKLPVERTISVGQQVGLALKLVKAVLRFHSTPWLQPLWRLQDLAYFPTDDEGLSASLQTLHITDQHRASPLDHCQPTTAPRRRSHGRRTGHK